METEQVHRVLEHIDIKFLEIGRLVQNEEQATALEIIEEVKRNLRRIRTNLSDGTFLVINSSLEELAAMCEQATAANENSARRDSAYKADRILTGRRGRPKLNITREQLEVLMNENYTAQQMAQILGCSTKLIYKKCYCLGLKFRDKYFNGPEVELRDDISELHNQFPNSGSQMMTAYLRCRGKIVQRTKVRAILSDVDPLGTACRWSASIHRRTYVVPTPNSLWHMDAHLKLFRWKIAVHGCVDGYSRLIVYLRCNTSMTAASVVPYFTSAVSEYGIPSRVRSDHGYENLFVALLMNAVRGLGRGSHIAGRSVHNQRIERLWVDVFKEVVDFFYQQFTRLEQEGLLDIENVFHIYALHKVYVKSISEKLEFFQKAWNSHTIRTLGKTPRQIWISGMLDNMNSGHTATNEVFNMMQGDLYTRVLEGFSAENMDINILDVPPGNENSQCPLISDDANEEINSILETALEDKQKYLQIVACIRSSQ